MPKINKQNETPNFTEQHAQAVAHLDNVNTELASIRAELQKLEVAKESALSVSLEAYNKACDALSDAQKKHARRTEYLQAQVISASKAVGEARRELDKEELRRAEQESVDAESALNSAADRFAAAGCAAYAAKIEIEDAAMRLDAARARLAEKAASIGEPVAEQAADPLGNRLKGIRQRARARTQAGLYSDAPQAFEVHEWIKRPGSASECMDALRTSLGYPRCNELTRFPLDAQISAVLDGTYMEKVDAINRDHSATFAANRERIAKAEKEQQSLTRRAITALTGIVRA